MPKAPVSTSNFGEAVKKFQDAGIHPRFFIPVAPVGAAIGPNASLSENVLGKAPGRYNARREEWGGLFGAVVVKGLTRADFEEASDWPTPNAGILGRAFPGIDSDATSENGRRVVERAIDEAFGLDRVAERLRGKGPRRLYALRAYDWQSESPVRTRHLQFTLPDDPDPHKLDVIGNGGQYLITGTHPSGDAYGWAPDAALDDPATIKRLAEVTNDDVDRFIETLTDYVERAGGEMGRVRGGAGQTEERNVRELNPTLSHDDIFRGLARLPNSPDSFLHRDDFVAALSAIRAAAGKDSFDPDFVDRVREWATAGGDDWCDDAYFDKIWKSLDRVRTPQDALDRLFRRNKIFHQSANEFDKNGPALSSGVRTAKIKANEERKDILRIVAGNYVFCDVNLREKQSQVVMRSRWCPTTEWSALSWFLGKSTHDDPVLNDLHAEFGDKETGFWAFMRKMKKAHGQLGKWDDNCFFETETVNPFADFGEIILDTNADRGFTIPRLNRWHLPAAIRAAGKPDPDPARSAADVRHILEFVNKLFGETMARYELDTLAFMVQKSARPGSMLFLVGEPGVGKSMWTKMVGTLFNGSLPEQLGSIDGSKLINENARRFALAEVEGCRIISIKEMPEGKGSNANTLKQITADLKRIVDPGTEGDYFQIERKGENIRMVQNFARVMASSNHGDAIEIEANDRRIFMVEAKIHPDSKPPESWYGQFVDIYEDATRLAAFYRYLQTRPIEHYSRNKPPPSSSAKNQSIVSRLKVPSERHLRAALELLKHNQRQIFDTVELAELMTDASEAESDYLGNGDPIINYVKMYESRTPSERLKFANYLRPLATLAIGLKQRRDGKERDGRCYVFNDLPRLAAECDAMTRGELMQEVERETKMGTPLEHPWETYRLRR